MHLPDPTTTARVAALETALAALATAAERLHTAIEEGRVTEFDRSHEFVAILLPLHRARVILGGA